MQSLRAIFKTQSLLVSLYLTASLASLLAFFLHSLVDPTFYVAPLAWSFMAALGVGSACLRLDRGEADGGAGEARQNKGGLFPVFFILAVGVLSGWISQGRIRAYLVAQKGRGEDRILEAARLDPWNIRYAVALADLYESKYTHHPTEENLTRLLRALDQAIEKNPFELSLYLRRAGIFFAPGRESEMEAAFKMMDDRLPNFYLGKLAAGAFYMNLSAEEADPQKAARLENTALRHYRAARKLSKKFKLEDLRRYTSPQAMIRWRQLEQWRKLP